MIESAISFFLYALGILVVSIGLVFVISMGLLLLAFLYTLWEMRDD